MGGESGVDAEFDLRAVFVFAVLDFEVYVDFIVFMGCCGAKKF